MRVLCSDEQRRHAVRSRGLNGLDYLEVSDDQRVLTVYFLGNAPDDMTAANVRVDGGVRVREVAVTGIRLCSEDDPELDDCMTVTVDRPGDFSTYVLRVVEVDGAGRPTGTFHGFDPRYAQLAFSFKVGCPGDLDCAPVDVCPTTTPVQPEINYLAKDYASFRQLIFDRLALTTPQWDPRHVPDLGVALVELLAYIGDHLSYFQDAVATEAYLGTARQRTSVRRHLRLVDYLLHEGCNARAWVCVETTSRLENLDPARMFFVTSLPGQPDRQRGVVSLEELRGIPADGFLAYEPVDRTTPVTFTPAHNRISFYTWGDRQCCLPKGAVGATLLDAWEEVPQPTSESVPAYKASEVPDQTKQAGRDGPAGGRRSQKGRARRAQAQQTEPPPGYEKPPEVPSTLARTLRDLQVGDMLIFEEVLGPKTGHPADADRTRRHAVRLTKVERGEDALYPHPVFPDRGTPVVEIAWDVEDALPFALCLTAVVLPDCALADVSVARGNVVLVDHGLTVRDEELGIVGTETEVSRCEQEGRPPEREFRPAQFRPQLKGAPLTFALPFHPGVPAARSVMNAPDPREARPAIELAAIPPAPGQPTPLFSAEDLISAAAPLNRVRMPRDPGAVFLRSALGPEQVSGLESLEEGAGLQAGLHEALGDELRRWLQRWLAQPDLLASARNAAHFVVEVDGDGRAHLRFGDGDLGRIPAAGTAFLATYRIGSGPAGNVGADAIAHVVFRDTGFSGVELAPRNPLPASGGTPRESVADARVLGPHAARAVLQRAVTADDYARLAEKHPRVQRAAAALQWTGSGCQVTVAIDERGKTDADAATLAQVARDLARVRRIGHDVVVTRARQVALDIELTVCVLPTHVRGHVRAALLETFGNRARPDGGLGMFHPDNLTFGEGIFLSRIVAAAQSVAGVESVTVSRLERLFEGPAGAIESGVLQLGPFEIPRVDNDPSFPERGRLSVVMRGGR